MMHSNSPIARRRICSWKMSFTFLLRASLFTIFGAHIPYMMLQYLKLHFNRRCCYNFLHLLSVHSIQVFLKPSEYSFQVLLKFNVLLICFIIRNFISSMHNSSVEKLLSYLSYSFQFLIQIVKIRVEFDRKILFSNKPYKIWWLWNKSKPYYN